MKSIYRPVALWSVWWHVTLVSTASVTCFDESPQRVNETRLIASIRAMAALGAFDGPDASTGVNREALTDVDQKGRLLLDSWASESGLHRTVDPAGNTFYRRKGSGSKEGERGAAIALGSHLDSQPTGGRFDGSYGVLAALEVVRSVEDLGIQTSLDVEVVNWSNEEGSRFSPPMMGSGVATGELSLASALSTPAREDPTLSFGSELQRHGLVGDEPLDISSRNWQAYLEAHIEQGPILEQEGFQVGAVLGAQGQRTFAVEVEGFEGHSGTVPMDNRQDALVCASNMVVDVRRIGVAYGFVATVGNLEVHPNTFNTIPGHVTFSVDLRSPSIVDLETAEADMRSSFAQIAQSGNCTLSKLHLHKARLPVQFDSTLLQLLRSSASALGVPARDIQSGAGHDACYAAGRLPAAMLFIPCDRGISHNPKENAKLEDVIAGANVLLGATLRAAGTSACRAEL